MEEPASVTPFQRRFGIAVAWIVLVIATPFAFYIAFIPCNEVGASAAHVRKVAPLRLPWMSLGLLACCAALFALYTLTLLMDKETADEKQIAGCGAGCLVFLLLVILIGLHLYLQ